MSKACEPTSRSRPPPLLRSRETPGQAGRVGEPLRALGEPDGHARELSKRAAVEEPFHLEEARRALR